PVPTPASSRASAWPPAPTVASTTTDRPASKEATSATRTGRWGLSKHPEGEQAEPQVRGQDRRHEAHQVEALSDLGDQRSLHRSSSSRRATRPGGPADRSPLRHRPLGPSFPARYAPTCFSSY